MPMLAFLCATSNSAARHGKKKKKKSSVNCPVQHREGREGLTGTTTYVVAACELDWTSRRLSMQARIGRKKKKKKAGGFWKGHTRKNSEGEKYWWQTERRTTEREEKEKLADGI